MPEAREVTKTMSPDQCASVDRVIAALDEEFTATMGGPLSPLWNDLGDALRDLRGIHESRRAEGLA